MGKVTADNLNAIHIKAGRACIGWRTKDLAEAAGLGGPLVRKFERTGSAGKQSKQAMIDALENAGVELLNGGRSGARLSNG